MGNITVFSGKTVPFLTLWYDVIEGSPNPKPNGYQRAIPVGACGAKGLGTFAQTPVSGGLPRHTLPRMPKEESPDSFQRVKLPPPNPHHAHIACSHRYVWCMKMTHVCTGQVVLRRKLRGESSSLFLCPNVRYGTRVYLRLLRLLYDLCSFAGVFLLMALRWLVSA